MRMRTRWLVARAARCSWRAGHARVCRPPLRREGPGRVRHRRRPARALAEAASRWQKAVELDPTYAAAWNNLGIGYEQQGQFDEARKAYEKALQLDPNNNFIRQNYDLFREIYDRQNRVAIASLVVALGAAGCLGFYEIPVETPIQAKLDVSAFSACSSRAFCPAGSKAIDPNTETARLLRSQLRTKSELKVIDTDVLSLVDEVDKRRGTTRAAAPPPPGAGGRPTSRRIKDEKDLQTYESIFTDDGVLEEDRRGIPEPLIVTGSVLFTEISKSGIAVERPGDPTTRPAGS